jgi:hypothetical protein
MRGISRLTTEPLGARNERRGQHRYLDLPFRIRSVSSDLQLTSVRLLYRYCRASCERMLGISHDPQEAHNRTARRKKWEVDSIGSLTFYFVFAAFRREVCIRHIEHRVRHNLGTRTTRRADSTFSRQRVPFEVQVESGPGLQVTDVPRLTHYLLYCSRYRTNTGTVIAVIALTLLRYR